MNICERCRAELRDDDMVVDAATYVRTDTAIGPSEVEGVHELYHVACWYVGRRDLRETRRGRWSDIRDRRR
jgi:hypothetical protein